MPVPTARNLSYLGVAKETTPGTGVTPTAHIRYTPGSLKPKDVVNYLEDQGQRGSMVETYDVRPGTKHGELAWGGPVFPDELGWLLASHLGDVVTTGASAPFSHAIAIKNDGQPPKNYSFVDADKMTANAQRFRGQVVTELGLKWSADGMLEYTVKTIGWPPDTLANPTPTFTAVTIVPSWVGVFTIGGAANTMLMEGELTLKRAGQAVHTHNNTQDPAFTFLGPLTCTGKLKFATADYTEMNRYKNNNQDSFVLDFSQGAAAALVQVKATMTKCAYKMGEIDRGKDFCVANVDFEGMSNSTDVGATAGFSPVKFTLQNAVAASVYV